MIKDLYVVFFIGFVWYVFEFCVCYFLILLFFPVIIFFLRVDLKLVLFQMSQNLNKTRNNAILKHFLNETEFFRAIFRQAFLKTQILQRKAPGQTDQVFI